MEFEVRHDAARVQALYQALWAERFRAAVWVSNLVAVAAMTWLLLGGTGLAVAGTVLGAAVMFIGCAQVVREGVRRQVAGWLAEFGAAPLHYRIDADGLHETSAVGECRLRWHAFAPARELEGFLVLPRRPADSGQVIALPLAALPAAARLAIEDRLGAAGAGRMG
jgi:hypothetical protein